MKRPLMLALTLTAALLLTGAAVRTLAAESLPGVTPPEAVADPNPIQGTRAPTAHEATGHSAPASPTCEDGEQASGAKYRICTPTIPWNGDLLVYAHGYVAPDRPVEIPESQMVLGDVSITETVTSLGFAFATTSYRTNGLAVRPAISDLLDLVDIFTTDDRVPDHVYLTGVSEGGLITALSVEAYPEVYDGGLAMCGPYGDFADQINHFGDFRVVFDYFFPDLMPGEPLSIPASLMEDWHAGFFGETIEPAVTDPGNAVTVAQLLTVTGVSPYSYATPTSTDSIEQLLWYNVFATNDGVAKLGGQPFDNQNPRRQYSGSNDDARLNDEVARISADQVALDAMEAQYQTSGELTVPLVTVHTTGDEVVPYRHVTQYISKTQAAGASQLHAHIRVDRHGHCNFRMNEVLGAFEALVAMVRYPPELRVYLPLAVRGP